MEVFMTVEEFKQMYPNYYFIKTINHITEPDYELIKMNFVPDNDVPEFPENTPHILPLGIETYPGVLSRMSAMKAGAWAVGKCIQEKWEITMENVRCCLANLEMDF